jgi:hypothetical protein
VAARTSGLFVTEDRFESLELGPGRARSPASALARLRQARGAERLQSTLVQPWFAPLSSVILLVALTALSFRHQVFGGWTFPWDFFSTPTTTPAFVADTFGRGHPLSWTPFVASGFPPAVDPQAGVYFPIWWLFGLFRVALVLRLTTLMQVATVLFGALGVLCFARARRLAWQWAAVAATAYLFFGGFYGESEHTPYIYGFAYLPWLLWSLTPPADSTARWTRLTALPLIGWLVVAGAYPADVVSFSVVGALYLAVSLWQADRETLRRHRVPLMLALASTAAVVVAVLLPYDTAVRAHDLWRPAPPTAAVRAGEAIGPVDLLGLYLNPFAWHLDGSITSWAVGTPVLIGLFLLRPPSLRRHIPVAAMGVAALTLAMAPKIGVIGRLMAGPFSSLFPSRFPAADYKPAVAIAGVILAAEAWSAVAARVTPRQWTAAVGGGALLVGAQIAPSTYAAPTRTFWLLAIVVGGTVTLALVRPQARIVVCVLLVFITVDGWRDARDDLLRGTTSSWLVTPGQEVISGMPARDTYIRELPESLAAKPVSRPARVPPAAPLTQFPSGTNNDSTGWIADGYHLIDYGGTVERSLHAVESSATWTALMLEPWHAYTFPCARVGCRSGDVRLPSATIWRPSSAVRSLSYSASGITYSVDVTEPTLMVENELAIQGWKASTPKVRIVRTGGPLRSWRLSPGDYEFTATYHLPGAEKQLLAAIAAFLLLLGSAAFLWCHPSASSPRGLDREGREAKTVIPGGRPQRAVGDDR